MFLCIKFAFNEGGLNLTHLLLSTFIIGKAFEEHGTILDVWNGRPRSVLIEANTKAVALVICKDLLCTSEFKGNIPVAIIY
jgi:hypothetical protein